MNSAKAKEMRRLDPTRPNPGRVNGGANKMDLKSIKIQTYLVDQHGHMQPSYDLPQEELLVEMEAPPGQEDDSPPEMPIERT